MLAISQVTYNIFLKAYFLLQMILKQFRECSYYFIKSYVIIKIARSISQANVIMKAISHIISIKQLKLALAYRT